MCIIWWALCEGIICCALSHKFAKCNFEAQSIHETPSPISAEAASCWCICAQSSPANYLYAAHIACSMVHIAYCTLLHLHAVRSIWCLCVDSMESLSWQTQCWQCWCIFWITLSPPFLNIQSQERCFNFIFVLNFSLFSPLSLKWWLNFQMLD